MEDKYLISLTDDIESSNKFGDLTQGVRKILILIRDVQKHILGRSSDSTFSLYDFLTLCGSIPISGLQHIQIHLKNTLELIKSNKNQDFIFMYGILETIISLFDKIISPELPLKQEHMFLRLGDEELRYNASIVDPLTKFDLLFHLLSKKMFFESPSILMANDSFSKIILILSSGFDKNMIIELFKEIKSDNKLIDFVDRAFPYSYFQKSNFQQILFWIPLAKNLIKSGIKFSYTINNNKFEFNEDSTTRFWFDLIMNETETFSLSQGSAIFYGVKKNFESKIVSIKIDFVFYSVINELSQCNRPSIDTKFLNGLFHKYKNIIPEKDIIYKKKKKILSFIIIGKHIQSK